MGKNKMLTIMFTIMICLSMLFSIVFMAQKTNHQHTGDEENCSVCMHLEACGNTLKSLGYSLESVFVTSLILGFNLFVIQKYIGTYNNNSTLISLKVKLTI